MFRISFVFTLILAFFLTFASATSVHAWNKRPEQFRMQIYSKPFRQGTVQNVRTHTKGKNKIYLLCIISLYNDPRTDQIPCWNLSSKRVGSYALNDPLVKITFYKVRECFKASIKLSY